VGGIDGNLPRQPYLHVLKCRGSAESFSDAAGPALVGLPTIGPMDPAIASQVAEPAPTTTSLGVWRIVGYVVGFQVLVVLIGAALFSVIGLAGEGTGGCGGG
jgi:hypothetical protein